MTSTGPPLPSWRPGATRDAVLRFLDDSVALPVELRVACFDNDGTLWCERPNYIQFDFFVAALHARSAQDESLRERPEFAAVLGGDSTAIGEIGLARIAMALTGLFEGLSPAEFAAEVRAFMFSGRHPTLHRPLSSCVYQPMRELITELRRRHFTIAIVSGGGTEFVRAVSQELYGVPPEAVVGTLIDYDYRRTEQGPVLRRSSRLSGTSNEGAAKVSHIQAQLGRRPVIAAGNSGGDREMLEWVAAADAPTLALLVDHDDAEREFAYISRAETVAEPEPITDVGHRQSWTVISMARDWDSVFAPEG
jgi:phosphoserine phosphatase